MADFQLDQRKLDLMTEEAVLSAMILNPDLLDIAGYRLVAEDFENPVLANLFSGIMALHDERRTVTIGSVARILGGDVEIEPGLTGTAYATQLIEDCTNTDLKSFRRNADVLVERRTRRKLAAVGAYLIAQEAGAGSVIHAAGTAVSELDEIRSSLRAGERTRFGAGDAVAAAIEHWTSEGTDDPITGIPGVDMLMGGWPRGQLSIVAARPAMGKSAFVICGARRAAHKGSSSLIFSLEMTKRQIGARLLADECFAHGEEPIHYEALGMKTAPQSDRNKLRIERASERLRGLPIEVEEQRGMSASEIVSRIGRHVGIMEREGKRLDTVYVDHIGLVRPSKRYAGNRHREVAEISDALATAAKELNVAIVGMCQLNRGVEGRENKRPSLADLRDSGSIEEDASAVLFLYRPAYYLELQGKLDDPEKEATRIAMMEATANTLEVLIAKNRNGKTGRVEQFVDIGSNAIRPMSYGR